MSDSDRPSILLPIRVLKGEQIETGIDALLANARVVLLGYHELPEQTPTGQARMQYEDQAMKRLGDLRERFEDAGAVVDIHLVFTHDREKTLERIATEQECLATVLPNPAATMEEVLLALEGDLALDRIVAVAGGLFADSEVELTLYHVDTEGDGSGEALLDRARTELVDNGVAPDRIEVRIDVDDRPLKTLLTTSEGFDAVIMGESDPSVITFLFGEPSDQVAERFLGPVLVVRRERREDADLELAEDADVDTE